MFINTTLYLPLSSTVKKNVPGFSPRRTLYLRLLHTSWPLNVMACRWQAQYKTHHDIKPIFQPCSTKTNYNLHTLSQLSVMACRFMCTHIKSNCQWRAQNNQHTVRRCTNHGQLPCIPYTFPQHDLNTCSFSIISIPCQYFNTCSWTVHPYFLCTISMPIPRIPWTQVHSLHSLYILCI